MEIRWLKSFLVVAEEGHFSRAARRLNLTQPSLTAQIQQLEEYLGQRLIERTNRVEGLTPAGKWLVQEAREVVERSGGWPRRMLEALDGGNVVVRMGIIPPAATGEIAEVFRRHQVAYPKVRFLVRMGHQDTLVVDLMEGRLDGVIGRPEKYAARSQIVMRPLFLEQQGILLSALDPLAKKKKVALRDIAGRDLLLLLDNLHFGTLLLDHAERHGVSLYPRREAADFPALHWMVRAGLGVAPASLALEVPASLVIRPLNPAPESLGVCLLGKRRSLGAWWETWGCIAEKVWPTRTN